MFRQKKPSSILPSRKVGDDSSNEDTPPSDKKTLPTWAKYVIGFNLIMVHLVVVMVGFTGIPFELSDGALVAYIVIGLGMPIGLANRAVRHALTALFGVKS